VPIAPWERSYFTRNPLPVDQIHFAGDFAESQASQQELSNDDIVNLLNDLLENGCDGEYEFLACAEEVGNANAKQLFANRADGCRQAGIQLIELIRTTAVNRRPAALATNRGNG